MRNRSLSLPVKLSSVTLGAGLVLAGIAAAPTASAQDAAFPFPSSNISSGQITSVLTSHELRADYNRWREQLIERCPQGDARMKYPESGNDTRSEGVGYGMVISAYMGDKATFDGLWNYYQRTSAGTGLMNWRRTDCAGGGGGGDTGSASDADVDAALGLIVANRQWPGQGYNTDAAALVADIRSALFLPGCPALLTAGSQFAACGCINPSYLPPGYYPAFAANDAGQAQFWTNAVNGTYTYFNAIRTTNGNTNLVPAWSSSNGSLTLACSSPPQVSGGGATNQFQADAARTPWRVATDFQWTGSANADAFLQRIVTFAKTQRVAQIVSLYSLAGQPLNGNGQGATLDAEGTRSSFTMGGLASAMTAGTQEDLDAFTGAWQSLYRDGDEFGDTGGQQYRAFNNSLALLYGLTVTGNMWNPMGPNPTPNTDPPLATQQGNLLVNGDFDEGLLGWKFQNIQGDGTVLRGEGYAMHLDGEMHLVVTRAANPDTLNYQVRLQQTATVQNGQNYLISVRARSDAERPFSVGIENAAGGGNIANLGNRRADAPLTLTTEMRTYDWVFTSTASGTMNVNIDVASSDVDLVLDDVVLAPTDLAPTTTGDLAGVEPDPGTGTPDPGTPGTGTPGTGTPGGTPTGTPGDGTIGTVDPTGDTPGSTGSTPGATPGAPNPDDSVAGLPPAPTTAPGAASCSAQNPNVCAPALCSVPLGLCYDANTGYVWSPMQNTYTQPPRGVQGCAADQVYWPKFGLCYIPETGWIYNPVATANAPAGWQFYGIDYTQNKKPPAEDSGCSVASAPGSDAGSKWMFAGLLGAALGLTMRRRKA